MNEMQLIRSQLALERRHADAVANACAGALGRADANALTGGSPLGQFRQACVDYLACVLAWFEERDQRLADFARARGGHEEPARRALQEALASPGRSREALEKLAGACAHTASWQEFANFFNGAWCTRRDALDAWFAPNPRIADWRALGGLDADSILQERELYARVEATRPANARLERRPTT